MLLITIFGAIFIHSAYSQAAQYSRNFGNCLTPRNERSVCVFLNECGDLYNILKRYKLLRKEEDKNYLAQSQCGYEENSILVCCPPRSPSHYPPAPTQPIQGAGGTESGTRANLLPQPGVCGIGSTDKIYGGDITKIDEFPWMCLLEYSKQILFPTERTETTQYSRIFGECLTPRNERSVCVFLSECGDLYNILRSVPLRENDKTYLRRSQCGKSENSILVCCPPRSPSRYPPAPTQPNQGAGGTESGTRANLLPQPGVCGIGSTDRIYGGDITKIDEFPWMCLLEYSKQAPQFSQIFGECLTPRNERSVCVFLNECGDLYNILTRVPLGEDDKIYLRRSQCGYQSNSVLVCCPPRSPPRTTSAATQPIRPTPSSNVNQGESGTENRSGNSLLPTPGVCGTGSADKIYGGNITKIDEFPWMCLLEYSKPNNRKGFHCGGSLITSRYVITASHCVNGKAIPSDWRLTSVRLGEWDTGSDDDCDQGDCSEPIQDVAIERAITHEQYDPNSRAQYHDLALLRLVRNIVFTDWIKPICLPIASELRDTSFEGITLEVAGWGKTESGGSSRYKMKARVDGVPLQNCNQVYARQNVELLSSQMCAGGKAGIDSCSGDSGGPLIGFNVANRGRPYFFLAGVVSFGPNPCALQNWPGVYTRTGHYINWIESHLSP